MDQLTAIRGMLRDMNGLEPDEDADLFQSGHLDSFSLLELVARLEDSFAVKIPDDKISPATFRTPRQIDLYIETLRVR